MILIRLPGWQDRLVACANARTSTPYAYGTNDCWCFTRAAVEAVTGELLLPDIEPPKTWLAAAKVLIVHGWESVEDLMTATLGQPMASPTDSRPGDIVSFELLGSAHLAVRIGDTALTPGPAKLEVVTPGMWRNAWRVG